MAPRLLATGCGGGRGLRTAVLAARIQREGLLGSVEPAAADAADENESNGALGHEGSLASAHR